MLHAGVGLPRAEALRRLAAQGDGARCLAAARAELAPHGAQVGVDRQPRVPAQENREAAHEHLACIAFFQLAKQALVGIPFE